MEKKVIEYMMAKGFNDSTINYILSREQLKLELAGLIAEYEKKVAKEGLVGREAYDYFVSYQTSQRILEQHKLAMK